MSFRLRLALLFVAVLTAVQALTAVLVYEVTRRELVAEGTRQLTDASRTFVRQLDDISERISESVEVMASDFALRSAVAQHDRSTVLSALRNHGRRVGAERMQLIGLDRKIVDDITDSTLEGTVFPYPDLIDTSLDHPSASVVAFGDNAYWMVVVPVLAPVPIGYIATSIPIDDRLLERMQRTSELPKTIEIVTGGAKGQWVVAARGGEKLPLAEHLLGTAGALPAQPGIIGIDDRDFVALAVRLDKSERSTPMAAVLGYSIDDALEPYRRVAMAWAGLLALGLVIGLGGAFAIARGVSRPVEALAASAVRIEAGDYAPPPPLPRTDEIGKLSAAFTSMARAIGEREERIRFQAAHDIVTGLPNRLAAQSAIEQSIARTANGALLAVGLARLPEIVKTMGHDIADRLTRHAAELVQKAAGSGGPVARIGDTVLAVWMPGAEKNAAITMAFAILDALREPYREADLAIDAAPAVGIALHPQHGAKASLLMQRAEVALLPALGSEDPVSVYDPATDPHRPERLSLMGDLLQAIERDHLRLFFQPKVNLQTRTIDSVEALVRWQHPVRGLVPPDAFIGLAEETGNIRRLTRWVLATGAAQGREWAGQGWNMRIAVNISARDLGDPDLPRRVSQLLALHSIPPERLVLEITESAVMGEPNAAIGVLQQLAERGIDLAIDDFGVGQSSFAYLRRLPVRELKIDQTFIRRLGEDAGDQTIVRSIVELGHRLGYRVTAEGVEDLRAFDTLARIGCNHAQGYFIAKPMDAADFAAFVEARRWPVGDYKEAV